MGYLKALKTLKRLSALKEIGETPVGCRFNDDLLEKWNPLMRSLASRFAIPRRMDADDIFQELTIVLWNLTRRVDPVSRDADFRRLTPVEMKNRCVDLTRFYKAQKRALKAGKGMKCSVCCSLTPWTQGSPAVCSSCGAEGIPGKNTELIRWIDLFVYDVSIGQDVESGNRNRLQHHHHDSHEIPSSLLTVKDPEPVDLYLTSEMVEEIARDLPEFPDRALFRLYVDPPLEFVQLLLDYDYSADPRRAPYWLLASYLGDVSEKVLRMAFTRIALFVSQAVGRPDLIGKLSPYNLKQIGYTVSEN